MVNISTSIFRFENYWMEHDHFLQVVQHGWSVPVTCSDPAKIIMARFKNLRRVLRSWQAHISSLSLLIINVKLLINFMEVLEEYRDLSLQEWNFKALLNENLTSLLNQQKIYWKQRGNLKHIEFGDGNTKFFHANATIKFRRNSISSLQGPSGEQAFDHSNKAAILWKSFKDRLGISELSSIEFDLQQLLTVSDDLQLLDSPFSMEEIDQVVKQLPLDKSPGPDGFNTDFIKKCWHIIAPDFDTLMDAFYEGDLCRQSINGSYITLVPKKDNPPNCIRF